MTATMKELPYEIWEQIFLESLPSDDFKQPSSSTAPLLLCQVNKRWRDCALSTPSLWSSLSIKIARRGCIPRLSLVPVWLQRADGRPLDISLTLDGRPGFHAFVNADSALKTIAPFFQRWRHVVLRLGPFISMPTLLEVPHVDAHFFESLDLFLPSGYSRESEFMDRLATRSPNLRRLKLTAELPEEDLPHIDFPFAASLKSLIVDSPVFSINSCIDILSQCTGLEEFQAHDTAGHNTHSPRTSPITLPDLKIFTLSTAAYGIAHLTENITMPTLTFFGLASPYNLPWRSLNRLFDRSACPLSELILSGGGNESEVLGCLLSCSKTLKHLSLHTTSGPYMGDEIFHALVADAQSVPFPRLTNISFGPGLVIQSSQCLAEMVRTRIGFMELPEDEVGKISVYVPREHPPDIIELAKNPPHNWRLNVEIELA